ncbi:bifunctional metallophosphatase/5'-nucleotidase [Idiomarina aminovorans]|uniref:bifunctional metallophosphatase/5'-nucleotidase n=1 Tax=Idiomarina aminovorans TaxID=2914829 RepID=UPI002002ED38|nr:5'-nucleotidase C-terminal domain-containing protein [Idiomarina sp. ATCH4]MCK7458636.1 5'-nucleotidase C-terminal domain-containing protein [Idiomarina sp. ATCH4]
MKTLRHLFILHSLFFSLLLVSTDAFSYAKDVIQVAPLELHKNSPFDRAYTLAPISDRTGNIKIQWPDNWPSKKPSEQLKLRVLHINDLHNKHIIEKDDGSARFVTGLMAAHVNKARCEASSKNEHVLFLSAGDDHTGAVYDELLGYNPGSFKKSLAYHAYSSAGLDVAVLGNHEFDRGTQILKEAINADANFPLLSSNLVASKNLDAGDYASALLGIINGWRIAIVGQTSSEDTKSNLADDPQLKVAPQLQSMSQVLTAVEGKVDVIIALTHIGYQQSGKVGDQDIAELLAKASVPAIVIGGHSHDILHKSGINKEHIYSGVPVFQAGQWGDYIGDIQLNLRHDSKEVVISNNTVLHSLEQNSSSLISFSEDFYKTSIAPVISDFDDVLNEPLGRIPDDSALTKHAILVDRYTAELAVANFITDAVMQTVNTDNEIADLAAINASSIVNGFEPGEMATFSDWYNVIPYADTLQLIELTPNQLIELIKSNAQRLVMPSEQESLDLTGFINQGFLHFSGALRYEIKYGQDKRPQAKNIQLNGELLEHYESQTITLLVGDYIASGNLGWRGQTIQFPNGEKVKGFNIKSLPIKPTSYKLRESVLKYLRQPRQKIIDIRKDGRIKLRH